MSTIKLEYDKLSKREKEFVIEAGLEVLQYTKSLSEGKEIKQVKVMYNKEIRTLKTLLDEHKLKLTESSDEYSKQKQKFQRRKDELVREYEDKLASQLASFKRRERELEEQIRLKEASAITTAMEQMDCRKRDIERPYVERISSMEESIRRWQRESDLHRETINRLQKEIQTSNERLQLFSKSQKRGEAGERNIFDLLQSHPLIGRGGWEISDTSKTGGKGDIHIIPPDQSKVGSVLCEVKLWDSTVTRDEVLKFQRDVIQSDVGSGIFVSLRTSIAGIRSGHIEYLAVETDDTIIWKPVIYLVGESEVASVPTWVLVFNRLMTKIEKEVAKMREIETNGIDRGFLQQKLVEIMARIEPMLQSIKTLRKTVTDQTTQLETMVRSTIEAMVMLGEDTSISIQTKRVVKKKTLERDVLQKWKEEQATSVYVGKEFVDYFVKQGVTKTKAEKFRKEVCDKLSPSDENYTEKIGDLPKGKVYWSLKSGN